MRRLRDSAIVLALLLLQAVAPAVGQDPEPFDPYRAEKAVEVGRFYLKKKNYDAAIDRFQEAIRLRPRFALPHRLLGEAFEKKGMKAEAVSSYETYLEILPNAEDAEKVRSKIAQVKKSLEQEKSRRKKST
jgi:tetratricopeptide (TPR) repeat protein